MGKGSINKKKEVCYLEKNLYKSEVDSPYRKFQAALFLDKRLLERRIPRCLSLVYFSFFCRNYLRYQSY